MEAAVFAEKVGNNEVRTELGSKLPLAVDGFTLVDKVGL
jgi:hypothetical protein